MNKEAEIEHPGTVEQIAGNKILVRLAPQEDCNSCHAKSACGMADVSDKVVEIGNQGIQVSRGDQVVVALQKSLGLRALALGYGVPLLLLIASLFLFSGIFKSEVLGGLFAIGLVGLYYLALYFLRNKIDQQFIFTLKKPV